MGTDADTQLVYIYVKTHSLLITRLTVDGYTPPLAACEKYLLRLRWHDKLELPENHERILVCRNLSMLNKYYTLYCLTFLIPSEYEMDYWPSLTPCWWSYHRRLTRLFMAVSYDIYTRQSVIHLIFYSFSLNLCILQCYSSDQLRGHRTRGMAQGKYSS